jgi:hypothetical protein
MEPYRDTDNSNSASVADFMSDPLSVNVALNAENVSDDASEALVHRSGFGCRLGDSVSFRGKLQAGAPFATGSCIRGRKSGPAARRHAGRG